MKRYFVAYTYRKTFSGDATVHFGNTDWLIHDHETFDWYKVAKALEKNYSVGYDVVVINWFELPKEKP
jgi:hypothetical protein